MRAARWLRCTGCALSLLVSLAARAGDLPATGPRVADPVTRDLEFRADRLQLDPDLRRLRLEGHVSVWVDRYRLSSEKLALWTEQRSVHVEGPAELAFCPCPSPPLTLRFASAQIAPSEVILHGPTLKAFGVPVLWLPWLWLRAPSEWGLLPLEFAYRGNDGLLLGSGIHAPLARGLDVSGAGYVQGGAEVGVRLTTERTSSFVRWDHLRDTALTVDLRGFASPDAHSSIAWSVDSLRGERALRGPSLLEEVSLRQDRARGAAGYSDGGTTLGIAVEADALRGAPLTSATTVGPSLYVGFGAPLGTSATANADVGVATWSRPGGSSLTALSQRAELRGSARAGPLALDVEGRTRALATLDETGVGYSAASAVVGELSAPFVKELGPPSLSVEHWITPFMTGIAGVTETREPSASPGLAPNGALLVAAGGVRSTLGERTASRAAVSASVQAGYGADGAARGTPLAAWRATGQGTAFALSGEGALAWGTTGVESVTLAVLRVGPALGPFLEGRAAGMASRVPLLARLLSTGFDAPWFSWLTDSGWSVGGRMGVPWTRSFGSTVDVDYDARHGMLLGLRGGVTYRHPCGCLSATAWAGHRAGREGADGFVTVGLSP